MENFFYGKHKTRNLIIYFVILVSWLSFIFSNSLANGTVSSERSDTVVKIFLKPDATADDVRRLIEYIQSVVFKQTGIGLECEICFV